MSQLYGRSWTRRELEARTGRIGQIAGVRRLRLQDGPERDVEQIEVRTGTGLRYLISPERGLDLGLTEFAGVPLSWLSPNGMVHPAYFAHRGIEWLRTAAGGALMTCGLRQAGSPNEDDGEELGIHGRAHHTPAREVCAFHEWSGDACRFVVSGNVEETRMFGENIVLHRRIESWLGRSSIRIQDRIENRGFRTEPLMLLYHFNFGFPLMDAETSLHFPSSVVEPRETETPREGYDAWEEPQSGYEERVYYHSNIAPTTHGIATARIHNPQFPLPGHAGPLTVRVRWSLATLPKLVQWKMCGEGMHVLGIEPANCHVGGRAAERAKNDLQFIEPGETVDTFLELEVFPGRSDD